MIKFTSEVIPVHEVLHVSESPGPVLDYADLGVEAFQNGVGFLGVKIVEYLNCIDSYILKKIIFSKENVENIEFLHKKPHKMDKKRIKYNFSDIISVDFMK